MIIPLVWMVVTSFETLNETRQFPPILVPGSVRWQNYRDVLQQAPFARWFLNTLVVTVVVVIGNLHLLQPGRATRSRGSSSSGATWSSCSCSPR